MLCTANISTVYKSEVKIFSHKHEQIDVILKPSSRDSVDWCSQSSNEVWVKKEQHEVPGDKRKSREQNLGVVVEEETLKCVSVRGLLEH